MQERYDSFTTSPRSRTDDVAKSRRRRSEPAPLFRKATSRALSPSISSSSTDSTHAIFPLPREDSHSETSTDDHRILLHQLQKVVTIGAGSNDRQATTRTLPRFGGGNRHPPMLSDEAGYVVEYDGTDDPVHPQNWKLRSKLSVGATLAFVAFCSNFASSSLSPSDHAISAHYHISLDVATLTTSLYILGYAIGPLIWAPLSELKGRRPPILLGMFGSAIFCIATATSKDVQTLVISRFFAGLFGSSPLSIVAAAFSDMCDNAQRGIAIVIYTSTVLLGPTLAPCVGAFVQNSSLGWRWNAYILAIMSAVAFLSSFYSLRETYSPVILVQKAQDLRRQTQNWAIHARQEEVEIDLQQLLRRNLMRPLRLLILEPVILLVSIQLSIVYAILYAFSTAYSEVFEGTYGISPRLAGLPLLGMMVGILLGAAFMVWRNGKHTERLQKNGGIPIPEWRLASVSIGAAMFAAALVWFGWTGYNKSIPWIVPVLSGVLNGAGLMIVYVQLSTYVVESYLAL